MLCRVKKVFVSFVGDRRGSQAVEILMILAIAAMTMFGVANVAGIGVNGVKKDKGIFSDVGNMLKEIGLGGFF